MTKFRRKPGALKGASRVKRLIRRLPDTAGAAVLAVYQRQGPAIMAMQQQAAPRGTRGRIADAIGMKVFPKSLRLRVGIIGKPKNRDLFYARILEVGRKAQTVTVKRRTKDGGRSTYRLRVKPISKDRFDFVWGRASRQAREMVRAELKTAFQAALRRATLGGID